MFHLETLTPAASYPVVAADMKAHLRLNTSDEDALLAPWASAACDLFTLHTGYVPINTTFRVNVDALPFTNVLLLPRYPVSSVTSVEYLDQSATWQTLAGYYADLTGTPGRIILPVSPPSTHYTQKPILRATFVAGTGSSAAGVAPLVLQAIKLLAAH